ncbi:hypothetical protein [Chitinolyticbacter meiyuanensis]|uniref:hypothetical protein n=1 Tax=Chitinolyticbacter meiyuanensis TaxID=682798 RepID=UPI0011E5EA87|nr:hypothetical protein [Chitinolyticbacter meiyuanensis]
MTETLSIDALEALAEIGRGLKSRRLSPRVFRHIKQLTGLKFVAYGRNGIPELTDKGRDALFLKSCIDAIRLLLRKPDAAIQPRVLAFLLRKGHIEARDDGSHAVTAKGAESLADIDAQP